MEKQPKFIKEFSKQQSLEERDILAKEIKQKRAENFTAKKEMNEKEKELQEKLTSIKQIKETIDKISNGNLLRRLKDYFKLKNLQSQLAGEKSAYAESKKEIVPSDMEEPKRMLNDFYANEKKKWENAPYSKEDIEKNFREEHLASLSLENYILLMKRFPNQMVTHVTRQGVRDHARMTWHTKGEGEFQNGFEKIIEDGRLRSPLGITLIEKEKQKAIEQFLHLEKFSSKEDALKNLEIFTRERQDSHNEIAGEYVDSMAIHFATEEVADDFYGGETGNEIFFAFPSAQIASQYYFNGQLKDAAGGQRNDVWVWASEEKGIDINSTLVFIPENAKVNKKTGSKYELDENKSRKINAKNIDSIKRIMKFPALKELVRNIEKTKGDKDDIKKFETILETECEVEDEKLKEYLIKNPGILANLEYLNNFQYFVDKKDDEAMNMMNQKINQRLKNILNEAGVLYEMAKEPILSKEYWENYFIQHPEQKPSKIIYYNGNPTFALKKWKEENGIEKRATNKNLGFKERLVSRESSQATAGIDRFKIIAQKVIKDYFETKS